MAEEKNDNANIQNEEELYEVGFHILPLVTEEDVPTEVLKIKDVLEGNGARITVDEGPPKLIQLAYEISKKIENQNRRFNQAYFGWIKFEALPEKAGVIKEALGELPNILRFIVVKTVRSHKMTHGRRMVIKKPQEKTPKRKKVSEKKEKIREKGVDEAIDELVIE